MTCHDVSDIEGLFVCSRCGAELEWYSGAYSLWVPGFTSAGIDGPLYCPGCGAQVVPEGDDKGEMNKAMAGAQETHTCSGEGK